MRFQVLLSLALSVCFSSCAVHGVVVNKSFRPMPAMGGTAAEGMYRLELVDQNRVVHPQLVSRAVFAAYQVGDDFDAGVALNVMVQRNIAKREQATKPATQWAQQNWGRKGSHQAVTTVAHISLRPEMLPETEAF